jgi:hypothetical protein
MWLWLTPQSHAMVKWVNGPQPHSDTLIYLIIYNPSKWWQLYPHTYNHARSFTLTLYYSKPYLYLSHYLCYILPLITEPYLLYWNHTSILEPYLHYWSHKTHYQNHTFDARAITLLTYLISLLLLQPLVYPSVLSVYWCLGT